MAFAKVPSLQHRLVSYKDAKDQLGTRKTRKLANNTYLVPVTIPEAIAVRLHQTYIVMYKKNGDITLNSGGWRTMTTRSRFDVLLPDGWRVWADKGEWYLSKAAYQKDADTFLFQDGITIKPSGKVTNAGDMKLHKQNQLTREKVKRYAAGFWNALKKGDVPAPSGGDCWMCCMFNQNQRRDYYGIKGGTVPNEKGAGGIDHLLQHMKEKYYVPSLLLHAMDVMGASQYTREQALAAMHNQLPERDYSMKTLERDVKTYLRRYMLRELGLSY
jgi:hypothetical protein